MRPSLQAELKSALRSGLPVAVLLALSVGIVVAVGANLSNSFPSADKPFGWPGPANFENGVAMVRPELVLAASLPALLLGVRALPRDGSTSPLVGMGAGLILVPGALLSATLIGAAVATKSPSDAYFAFWVAHTLLGLSCFAIGFLARAATRRHAAMAALGTWSLFGFVLDDVVRWQLFRSAGYDNLAAGLLPNWFYAMQALSPVSAYRAILILWRPGFRDFLEHKALDKAATPDWLSAPMISLVMLILWVVIPLAIAYGIHRFRLRRQARSGHAAPNPAPTGAPMTPMMALTTASGNAAAEMESAPRRKPGR